jgi:hypothetical protein
MGRVGRRWVYLLQGSAKKIKIKIYSKVQAIYILI